MVVRAERAFFQPDTEMADLEQVRAEVSDDVEGESFRMTCDNAELNVETNDFEAKGNVQGVTGEGQHYSAPWVKYDHATAMLYTDASVLVVDDSVTLRGEGFRYYIDDRHFELLGNVTVEQAR